MIEAAGQGAADEKQCCSDAEAGAAESYVKRSVEWAGFSG